MSVIWHDLECGSYGEDLPLWRSLAAEYGDPVFELGAGTGRVTLALARSRRVGNGADPVDAAHLEKAGQGYGEHAGLLFRELAEPVGPFD